MQLTDLAILSPVWPIFFLLVAGLLGACLGSFVNCLAWRLVHGESVWKGRSHCAVCNHPLAPLDLVPVLSWLFLRGRCRYCGERIAARYMAAELLCGLFFMSMVAVYGLTVHALALCALGCILLGLSLVDLETYTIPNGFIIAGIAAWAVSFAFYGVDLSAMGLGSLMLAFAGSPLAAVLLDGLLGAFVVAGCLLALSLVFDKVMGRRSLGGGDVKLVFMVGLFLGLAGSVLNLIVACVVGIVFAYATQNRRQDTNDPQAFPFGPSIALATWFTLALGPQLIAWYLGLF